MARELHLSRDFDEVEEEKDWENPDLPEGFDVYDYDAAKAKRGQRMVLIIFAVAFLLFVVASILRTYPVSPNQIIRSVHVY